MRATVICCGWSSLASELELLVAGPPAGDDADTSTASLTFIILS